MYEAFYGFKEKPFSMLPDPSFLFLSKKHRAALTLLEYGLMNQVGFCILSGEPGAGKTTILRALLNRVDDNVKVGLISNTHQSFGGLLDWILSAFDLHKANLTQVEMHQVFVDFLIEEYGQNRRVLLIVDEAQNMDPASLEELRMLSNVNTEKDQLLQVVLAGQPQLKENLRKPELSQFAQRIAVDYHLHSLSLNETCGYIQHRLVVAGAERDVFTPEACERIHCYSGGSPRLINLLCETALVYGFADEKELVDADLVEEMVHERMEDSVVPLSNLNGEKEGDAKNTDQLVKDFPWIRPEGGTKGLKPEVKARLADAKQAKQVKKEVKPKPNASGAIQQPKPAPQSNEPEVSLPNDLISQAEGLGKKVVSEAVAKPAVKEEVHQEQTHSKENVPLTSEKKKEPVVAEPLTPQPAKVEPVISEPAKNGSTQVRDAYEKEMAAKNQIKAAKSKSKFFKYFIPIAIAIIGLAAAGLYFGNNARDFNLFDRNGQVYQSDVEKSQADQQIKENQVKQNMESVEKAGSIIEGDLDQNTENATIEKLEQEKLDQEKQEQERLEQEGQKQAALEQSRLEQERLEKEKLAQEKAAKEHLEKERLEKEKLEKEKLEKEKLEQEQARQLLEFRELERREARKREAEAKKRIARQIKQREAELAAQEAARRQKLEADRIEREKREAVEKIKQKEEAKRLQDEWLEKEREKLRKLEATEAPTVKKTLKFTDDGFISKPEKKTFANCDGPAARFKTECR